MFRRKINHRDAEQYLSDPICTVYHEIGCSEELENRHAKAALRVTLNRAREIFPHCKQVFIGENDFTLHDADPKFVTLLLRFKGYLQTQQYVKACEECVDVLHFFRVEDKRILHIVITLLEEFL